MPGAPSPTEVANAGKGNRIGIGAGTSGWSSTMVPGRNRAGALAQLGRQEAVLSGLARVEPADDLDRGVADDRGLDVAGRLLGADEDDAEAAAARGDVDEHVLDRAPALARRVLVQLVEHDEPQRLAARALLLLEDAST